MDLAKEKKEETNKGEKEETNKEENRVNKVALCFIVSYNHVLNQESLWKNWIEPNKDWINVYVHYKDYNKIQSPWLRAHAIPPRHVVTTSYYHVVPAYVALLSFAHCHDISNKWFCMLTDSCAPLISPAQFKERFEKYQDKSIMRVRPADWNPEYHSRANLRHFPIPLHVMHDPWFTLTRIHVAQIMKYIKNPISRTIYTTVCNGGLANETVFAIMLGLYNDKELKNIEKDKNVMNTSATVADWKRRAGPTSPHTFTKADGPHMTAHVIRELVKQNPAAMFIRKMDASFVFPNYL